MRRAFTLVELMIVLLLITIFLNFIFRFYTNVLLELRYLEAKDSLTYGAFRASQIIKNGVYGDSGYIGGIMTLKDIGSADNNFTTHNNQSVKADTNSGKLVMLDENSGNSYKFNQININNFSLHKIGNSGLYVFEFNATKDNILKFTDLNQTSYTSYQRLVYTK